MLDRPDGIRSIALPELLLPDHDPLLDTPASPTSSNDSWESCPSQDDNPPDAATPDSVHAFDLVFDELPRIDPQPNKCLLAAEEIDFDFVYALHTFTATVEGQANATKGDTMVLLDDSNSYWWLVRVVKDSSIGQLLLTVHQAGQADFALGYLPAEHIETPRERLARLNKHRNIDVCF